MYPPYDMRPQQQNTSKQVITDLLKRLYMQEAALIKEFADEYAEFFENDTARTDIKFTTGKRTEFIKKLLSQVTSSVFLKKNQVDELKKIDKDLLQIQLKRVQKALNQYKAETDAKVIKLAKQTAAKIQKINDIKQQILGCNNEIFQQQAQIQQLTLSNDKDAKQQIDAYKASIKSVIEGSSPSLQSQTVKQLQNYMSQILKTIQQYFPNVNDKNILKSLNSAFITLQSQTTTREQQLIVDTPQILDVQKDYKLTNAINIFTEYFLRKNIQAFVNKVYREPINISNEETYKSAQEQRIELVKFTEQAFQKWNNMFKQYKNLTEVVLEYEKEYDQVLEDIKYLTTK